MDRRRCAFALPLLLLAGCRNPSPEVLLHTLAPLEEPSPATRHIPLEILPVRLPDMLQRPQIVLADGSGSTRLSASHRWGNALDKDMQRVLVENLSALLHCDRVVPYPLGEQVKADLRLSLDVQQCEGAPGRPLRFAATWVVTRASNGSLVLLRRTRLQEPVAEGGLENLVAAHDRVLDALCREIAASLDGLEK